MNIITVIPLTRSKVADELTYFTAADVPVGAIVSVPLRSKSIHAIVTEVRLAEDIKSFIKSAPFAIRKLNRVKASVFFPTQFVDAAKTLAQYYATSLGSIIDALVSDSILEQANKISPPLPRQSAFNTTTESKTSREDETYAVQGDDGDRHSSWRSLIRQEFARKRSVSFYVPSIEDARNLFDVLEKGIEGYIFMLNGSLPAKKIVETWEKIADIEHPIVVIATGTFALLPRGDIDTVVIERENGRGWISQKRPYVDLRHALEVIARRRRQVVFIGDSLLRTETLRRVDSHEISEGSPFKWRSISTAREALVDMRRKPDEPARRAAPVVMNASAEADEKERSFSQGEGVAETYNEDGSSAETDPDDSIAEAAANTKAKRSVEAVPTFKVLSREMEQLIRINQEDSTHLFLLAIRRGTSPTTVCSDCEHIVECLQCSSPVVLHTSKESGRNFFMCHACGARRSADESCKYCGSWRLTPMGIGIGLVESEIRRKFPTIEVFKIDADTTKTEKQISAAIANWKAKPGSILLGTEMAMNYLAGQVDHIAVVSMDSLFALPDFRIQEKIMYTLVRLRAQARHTFVVQTRKPEEIVFEYGLKGNLSDFYRTTIEERKQLAYPPFSTLVKITLEGKKDKIADQMAEIQKIVAPKEIDIFPAFTATVRGNSLIHGLIRIEAQNWPDPDLVPKLRALPPSASVKINPESLL